MSTTSFTPIQQDFSINFTNRPSSAMATSIPQIEPFAKKNKFQPTGVRRSSRTSNILLNQSASHCNIYNSLNSRQDGRSSVNLPHADFDDINNILLRRSSSVMKVLDFTSRKSSIDNGDDEGYRQDKEVSGSQKARLLVTSQQCLVSRLQDLKSELESMDNEVTRVRNDIVNSRRYFSAMMGIPCGPDWPVLRNQPDDSAYTSPKSSVSPCSDMSPDNSDSEYPQTMMTLNHPSTSSRHPTDSQLVHSSNNSGFLQLQNYSAIQTQPYTFKLTRSDSCSSFLSWRSEIEMENMFPDESTC